MLPVTRGFPYEASRIFITPVASRSLYGMALTEPLYKSLYNTIQYNTVLQIALQWLNQSIYQSLYLLARKGELWGCLLWGFWIKFTAL